MDDELRFYTFGASMTVRNECESLSTIEIVDGESLAEFSLGITDAVQLADWLNKRVADYVEAHEAQEVAP